MNLALVPGGELVFCFHSLPFLVWGAVSLGIHRGAARALATAQLRFGRDLRQLRPRFPVSSTMTGCESLDGDFGHAAAHIVAEIDVAEVLR